MEVAPEDSLADVPVDVLEDGLEDGLEVVREDAQEVTGPPAAAEHLAREKVDGQNLNFNLLQFKNVIKIFGT